MILTEEQLNILNHVVGDGQAWADHIENVFDAEKAKECLLDKVARHKPEYDEDDKADIEKRRAEVKAKYPKE